MPAGYAHLDFGDEVIKVLPENIQKLIYENIDLYHIGVHGPDILFYHNALKKNEVSQLGFQMHNQDAYNFFYHAKDIIQKSPRHDASLAYILGFITHFTLDSECHGYIGKMEKELNMTHSELESELDRQLLINNGFNPLTTSLTTHIHPSHDKSQIIAPFFGLTAENIDRSLKDLLFFLGMLLAPGKIKRTFILLVMKMAGIYKEYKGLMINYEKNTKSELAIEHLISLKENAIPLAKHLMINYLDFLNGQELEERYRRTYE